MKKVIILSVAALVVILGGLTYYFLGTPTYSLYKLKQAISQHDSITFNKYVDVDRLVSSLFDQATSSLADDEDLKGNFFEEFATSILSSMREQMKNEINKAIEEIAEGKDDKFVSIKLDKVVKEGKSAKVTLKNSDEESINIDMIQMPERYWRVVGINFEDFKKINPIELSDESGSNTENKKISSTVKFGDKSSLDDGWFITVSKPESFIPTKDDYHQPKKGDKFVSVEVEYSNESSEEDTANPSNLTLKDGENHIYEMYIFGGKEPKIEDDTVVPPNDKARGYVTFEVPENTEIVKAIYSNSAATVTFE